MAMRTFILIVKDSKGSYIKSIKKSEYFPSHYDKNGNLIIGEWHEMPKCEDNKKINCHIYIA